MRPEHEPLLQALGQNGEALLVSDGRRVLSASEPLSAITGYSIAELRGLASLVMLFSPAEREAEAERWRRRIIGERVPDHYETTMLHKDGSEIPVRMAVRAHGEGHQRRVVSVIRANDDPPATR